MDQFVDAAADLRVAGTGITIEHFDRIFELLNNRFLKLHAKAKVDQLNIESVFSLIEMGSLIETLPDTDEKDIPLFRHSIRRVLAETIEHQMRYTWQLKPEAQFRPPQYHSDLVKRVFGTENLGHYGETAKRWAFITFNYDLALDLALYWHNYQIDYGLEERPKAGSIPLLKLHGSINWARCSKCDAVLPLDFERVFRSQPRKDHYGSASETPATATFPIKVLHLLGERCAGHCADNERCSEPALVPPTWNKTQVHWNFARLWKRAAKELREAERIWVIGYSVPLSDAFFHDFLALSLAAPTGLRLIAAVNPDTEAAQRLRGRLGPLASQRFSHIAQRFEDFAGYNSPLLST